MSFDLISPFKPAGHQPQAIKELTARLEANEKYQTLLGVTGSGKTFVMAGIIARVKKPTLVISHNKTLAFQLYEEFKNFFPGAAVHYFVSYYDYYQPEAYLPQTDTHIEKDAKINEEIDRMRHAATESLLSRDDVLIIASVSCIYGIGSPAEYSAQTGEIKIGEEIGRNKFLRKLSQLQYERNDYARASGSFAIKGETIDVFSPAGAQATRIEWNGNIIEKISLFDSFASPGKPRPVKSLKIFPAKHFLTSSDKLKPAIFSIRRELESRQRELKKIGRILEAERLRQRVEYDLTMLQETGYVAGIENYSRHLDFREPGAPPHTLLDFFPRDYLLFIDESHMTIPQIRGMYEGDRSRKQTLVDFGFRLPSALDNRPLKFPEFEKRTDRIVCVSATPAEYELKISKKPITEQLVRPTGLLDPTVEIHPTKNQIPFLVTEIKKRIVKKQRVLVTTITKRLAEDLAEFLREAGIKTLYLHSEIKTLDRPEILQKLRRGEIDVLVGINLLREGLDLPEVALVAILDADKEGFLRGETALIQVMGRAARHREGHVIMFADIKTRSIKAAIKETERRRKIQKDYNKKHRVTPRTIEKKVTERKREKEKIGETLLPAGFIHQIRLGLIGKKETRGIIKELEEKMEFAALNLAFEEAAVYRDKIKEIKNI